MKYWFLCVVLLAGCGDDINEFDINKNRLHGKVGGFDWEYTGGSSVYDTFNNQVKGIIIAIDVTDPCSIRLTSDPHIRVQLPATRGNYNLPFIGNNYFVQFAGGTSGKVLTATSGFVEVVSISSTEIIGFMSADFDENNTIEGTFFVTICN